MLYLFVLLGSMVILFLGMAAGAGSKGKKQKAIKLIWWALIFVVITGLFAVFNTAMFIEAAR